MNLFDMFDLPSEKSDVQSDKALIQKKSKPRSSTMTLMGSGSIIEKIQSIVSIVASKFEKNKDKVLLIQTEQELSEYIDACIKTGVVCFFQRFPFFFRKNMTFSPEDGRMGAVKQKRIQIEGSG